MTKTGYRSRPEKTAMLLARRIVEDIRQQGLSTGDRLPPERAMLEEYQVGRGTLREALRFLELQKVISLKPGPGGGPTVEKPDASTLTTAMLLLLQFDNAEFSAVVETRRDLEPLMARLAAERMTADQLTTLANNVDQMRTGINDQRAFLEADIQFHALVAWGTQNAIYGFLIDAVIDILDGSAIEVDYPMSRREAVLRGHVAILEALQRRDGDASYEAMRRHVDEYAKDVAKNFPDALSQRVRWGLA